MKTFGKTKHIHFIGIGGIGMSGIAELLMNLGYEVSGSDLKETAITRRLTSLGGQVFKGHKDQQVEGADVVVYSSAVRPENPEIVEAKERGIPVIPRAEMLAELMRLKYGIAVAGAHGKTTTTSMLASILTCGGLDPTIVIGGRLDIWGGSNVKLGQGDILVAEADESDGSFLALSPTIAVITNIDQEHMEHYGNMEAIRDTFVTFINRIPFYGAAILCLDNEELQGIIPRLKKKILTYGMTSQADLQARNLKRDAFNVCFEAVFYGRSIGEIVVAMPGEHNVLNALAATAVGLELELDIDMIKEGLKNLGGLSRRFEIKGEKHGILQIDDYGHHPAEITATLKATRECWPERRVVVVFQPHRHTRTRDLFDRFVVSFNDADILIVTDIYSAGEELVEGVSAESLVQGIKDHGHRDVILCPAQEDVVSTLIRVVKPGDLVVTLGAGDIYKAGERFLQAL